ncbi:DnaA regulatory inactivator Hda [Herbaspirillum sp. C9C3]|uniref:DnaA regulatory inactivator Hda n=1 Tax=Herbaspirillum sp. C9C3 TaxID=2735271 RepID=UPI0015851E1E|nr:DnaA regulatory inactivator Hda [Herbaspirillum sp. C9C3]NUT59936.1 DnaA regulatory inactivator Hda [Herbaspirillum sp. C9C3]
MKQIPLDLSADQPQSFDSFVTGRNAELLERLKLLATAGAEQSAQRGSASTDRFIYLWAEAGAGKTHLLHALATKAGQEGQRARLIGADSPDAAFDYHPQTSHYLLDDVDQLFEEQQIAAFNLFNQIREQGGCMVCTGTLPPTRLELREDLRTRLGWGLIYQVHDLSDDEKIAALLQITLDRGLEIPPAVMMYMLTHYRRDMPSLSRMLDALDRYSLATKRAITLPLLRELLQQESEEQ